MAQNWPTVKISARLDLYKGFWSVCALFLSLPNARMMFNTEIWAHKNLKGFLKKISGKSNCCPKIPCAPYASIRFLMLWDLYTWVLWLKTDLQCKFQPDWIITNTFCRRVLEHACLVLGGLPNACKMFKTEIWAHKKLKGFLKNNPCEFQENQTILRSPKILWASFRFLRALRAHKIFDALRATYLASMAQKWCENFSKIGSCYLALRPLHGLVIWLKTDLLWKSHQDLIIANTFCRLHKMCIWTAELEHPLKGQHKDQHP